MKSSGSLSAETIDGYPGDWDLERLRENCSRFLAALAGENETSIPLKRLQFQMEQNAVYRDIVALWAGMNSDRRIEAWKTLLQCGEQVAHELLPTCVQCGECCRRGSPTILVDDLPLLRNGKIPWNRLYTLRRGEPVRSPYTNELVFLVDERIKIVEKQDSRECFFFKGETDECSVYADRPIQCRAQACWNPDQAKELEKLPYLTRRDLFHEVGLFLDVMKEHDERCSFEKLNEAFKRLEETRGESVDEVLELLAYEDHFRRFVSEKFKVPPDAMELIFGRSFADMAPLFGFRVVTEADGSRCLLPDRE